MVTASTYFSWVDYLIFSGMLLVSACIGIYFGVFGPHQNNKEMYILGGRNMNLLAVGTSLISSQISGIAFIVIPADVYRFGSNHWWITISLIFVFLTTAFIFLPAFFKLKLISIYGYFKIRFDNRVRTLASFLYTLSLLLNNSISIYIPALALAQVTGINLYVSTPIVCAFCIIYTTIGGFKAVIWTDVFQFFGIMGGLVAILILGLHSTEGFDNVWNSAIAGNRISLDFSWSPTVRDSFWTVSIGGFFQFLVQTTVNQGCIQKCLSLSTLSRARQALLIYYLGFSIIVTITVLTGNVLYTKYKDCDPLSTKQVERPDQMMPHFVMDVGSKILGIPGIFIAGVFSASLSTLSSNLNSMAATIYEDFISPFTSESISEKRASFIMKIIVVVAGVVSTGLVFVVANMGSIYPVFITLHSISAGPLLGLFLIGFCIPVVNSRGALFGGIGGLIFVSWIAFGNLWNRTDFTRHMSTDGCNSTFNSTEYTCTVRNSEQPFVLYRISIWYYTLLSAIVVIIVSVIISCLTKRNAVNT